MVTTRSAVISTVDSLVFKWVGKIGTLHKRAKFRLKQFRLEIVGVCARDLHSGPIAYRQPFRAADAHHAVYFRGIAAGARNGDIAVDSVDQHGHFPANPLRQTLEKLLSGKVHE